MPLMESTKWEYKVLCHTASGYVTSSVCESRRRVRELKIQLYRLSDTRRVSVIRRRVGKWETFDG